MLKIRLLLSGNVAEIGEPLLEPMFSMLSLNRGKKIELKETASHGGVNPRLAGGLSREERSCKKILGVGGAGGGGGEKISITRSTVHRSDSLSFKSASSSFLHMESCCIRGHLSLQEYL
jgi:hypothetical protein